MSTVQLELRADLAALLHQSNQPLPETMREMIVLELYRRGTISSGKAAEFLGMTRWQFIAHASRLGIAYFDMAEDEWEEERKQSQRL
jgi:predicted HTH domain antitoxin